MAPFDYSRRVVRRWPDPNVTCGGDYIEDDTGQVWKLITRAQAALINSSTCGRTGTLYPNGTLKP